MYVCDWYDAQVNHYRNHEGKIDPQNGRVYRLRAKGAVNLKSFDLAKRTTPELIELLGHGDKWHRQTALRLLGDRKDVSALPALKKRLAGALGQRTWVMLSHSPDWRWMLQRDDSPWYPNSRLFRQPTAGDWVSVVEQVRAELSRLAGR